MLTKFALGRVLPRIRGFGINHRNQIRLRSDIGFVLDIDGVLLRGLEPIPQAKEALELLQANKVPFILLTNGGGLTEKSRIEFISSRIGVPLSPLQIIQSHTPMKTYAVNKTYQRVMVVGGVGDKSRECAYGYGFKDVVMPIDFVKQDPFISPYHNFLKDQLDKDAKDVDVNSPIDAILVFHDSRDMSTDTQVILDLLNSENGVVGTKRNFKSSEPSVPIIFSNNDFVWPNKYNLPRFGQGALRIMIEALYREVNHLKPSENLKSTIMGKPFPVQYNFACHVLIDWREKLLKNLVDLLEQVLPPLHSEPKNNPFSKIYMVGDNPASDIKGANDYGWESLLLRTGVYNEREGTDILPTGGIHDNVLAAVKSVLR